MKRVPLLFDLSELFTIMSSEELYTGETTALLKLSMMRGGKYANQSPGCYPFRFAAPRFHADRCGRQPGTWWGHMEHYSSCGHHRYSAWKVHRTGYRHSAAGYHDHGNSSCRWRSCDGVG